MPRSVRGNWLKLHRCLKDHPIRKRLDWLGAWVDVLMSTDYATGTVCLTDVPARKQMTRGAWLHFVRYLVQEGMISDLQTVGAGRGSKQWARVTNFAKYNAHQVSSEDAFRPPQRMQKSTVQDEKNASCVTAADAFDAPRTMHYPDLGTPNHAIGVPSGEQKSTVQDGTEAPSPDVGASLDDAFTDGPKEVKEEYKNIRSIDPESYSSKGAGSLAKTNTTTPYLSAEERSLHRMAGTQPSHERLAELRGWLARETDPAFAYWKSRTSGDFVASDEMLEKWHREVGDIPGFVRKAWEISKGEHNPRMAFLNFMNGSGEQPPELQRLRRKKLERQRAGPEAPLFTENQTVQWSGDGRCYTVATRTNAAGKVWLLELDGYVPAGECTLVADADNTPADAAFLDAMMARIERHTREVRALRGLANPERFRSAA